MKFKIRIGIIFIFFFLSQKTFSQIKDFLIGKWVLDTCFLIENEYLKNSFSDYVSEFKIDEINFIQSQIDKLKIQLRVTADTNEIASINEKINSKQKELLALSSVGFYDIIDSLSADIKKSFKQLKIDITYKDNETFNYNLENKAFNKNESGILNFENGCLNFKKNEFVEYSWWAVFISENEMFVITEFYPMIVFIFVKT